jgi:hypothetical protein
MSHEKVDLKKEVYPLWISVFKKTAMLIYPIVVFCIVFADIVMVVLYGHQYETSSSFFRIKLLANFFTLISFAPLIINTGHVNFYSNVHLFYAFFTIVLEYLSVKLFDSPIAISWISSLCHISRIFVMLFLVARILSVKVYELFPLKVLGQIVIPSFVFLLIERFSLVNLLHLNVFLTLTISVLVYIIVYFFYTRLVKLDYMSIVKPLFSAK